MWLHVCSCKVYIYVRIKTQQYATMLLDDFFAYTNNIAIVQIYEIGNPKIYWYSIASCRPWYVSYTKSSSDMNTMLRGIYKSLNGNIFRTSLGIYACWCHDMNTHSALFALCALCVRIHWLLVDSPHLVSVEQSLDISLMLAWLGFQTVAWPVKWDSVIPLSMVTENTPSLIKKRNNSTFLISLPC